MTEEWVKGNWILFKGFKSTKFADFPQTNKMTQITQFKSI